MIKHQESLATYWYIVVVFLIDWCTKQHFLLFLKSKFNQLINQMKIISCDALKWNLYFNHTFNFFPDSSRGTIFHWWLPTPFKYEQKKLSSLEHQEYLSFPKYILGISTNAFICLSQQAYNSIVINNSDFIAIRLAHNSDFIVIRLAHKSDFTVIWLAYNSDCVPWQRISQPLYLWWIWWWKSSCRPLYRSLSNSLSARRHRRPLGTDISTGTPDQTQPGGNRFHQEDLPGTLPDCQPLHLQRQCMFLENLYHGHTGRFHVIFII